MVLRLASALAFLGNAPQALADVPAQPFACAVTASAPYVRYQGLAEQTGDIILVCTGGTATAPGSAVPNANIAISIQSTNITSRLLSSSLPAAQGSFPYSEAILVFDDATPASPNPANATLSPYGIVVHPCPSSNVGACVNAGTAGGFPSYGTGGNYNLFQGYQYDNHTLRFDGIPMDPPGPNRTMTMRFTNIRIDATPFQSTGLSGVPVSATVSVSGSQSVIISNPGATAVAYPTTGFTAPAVTPANSPVCNSNGSFTVQVVEGFNSAFKRQDTVVSSDGVNVPATTTPIGAQNVFGYSYGSESGYYNPSLGIINATQAGLATQGTRIWVNVKNIPAQVTVTAPLFVYLTGGSTTTSVVSSLPYLRDANGVNHSGYAHLVHFADSGGGGGYVPGSTADAIYTSASAGSGTTFVYEVLFSDPGALETININFSVSFSPGVPTYSSPPVYTQALVSLGPASPNEVNTPQIFGGGAYAAPADTSVPRFSIRQGAGPGPVFSLSACTCSLLFPYVTDGSGYSTGLSIDNTSLDPFGTTPQNGYVQLYYFPNSLSSYTGVTGPFTQTTQVPVGAGDQLLIILGYGSASPSNAGIRGVPGFSGYLIAVANFQYCHGYAFISDTYVQKFAEGYIANVLDSPSLSRTGVPGEGLLQ